MKNIVRKYKEQIMYLIFGVLTTVVNWSVYISMVSIMKININLANTIAWFIAVVFAYLTNKIFVFIRKEWKLKVVIPEICMFFGSRMFSGIIEIAGFPLLYTMGMNQKLFGFDGFIAKALVSVVVVIVNYILGKLYVFKEKMT